MSTLEQRADHAYDLRKHEPSPRHQKRAVIELVGYCWALIGLNILSPEIEKQLLSRIRNTCVEFDMDPPMVVRAKIVDEAMAKFDGLIETLRGTMR